MPQDPVGGIAVCLVRSYICGGNAQWCRCFGGKVSKLLFEVLQTQFALTAELAVLDLSILDIPFPLQTVTQPVHIAARFVIAQNWKS